MMTTMIGSTTLPRPACRAKAPSATSETASSKRDSRPNGLRALVIATITTTVSRSVSRIVGPPWENRASSMLPLSSGGLPDLANW